MDLTIIIVNYNVYTDVLICIESIYKFNKNINFEVIVVDNNSADKSVLNINSVYKDVRLIPLNSNHGFGYANNIGMNAASGKYILLVNPDIIFLDNSIEKLYKYLEENSGTGVAGPIQIKPNEGVERYYPFFPSIYSRITQEFGLYDKAPLMKKRYHDFWDDNIKTGKPFKVDWVIGSCMMLRREIYDKLGGFNEAFFLYEEEVEWQYRMRNASWESVILPGCRVLHNHHSSTSKLGIMFILYHEFRSGIIFSAVRYKFPLSILRRILTVWAIGFRMFYFAVLNFKSSRVFRNRLYLYFDLIKMVISSKRKILASRFIYSNYINYFLGNDNAKL